MGVIAKGIPWGCQGLFTPVSLKYPLSVFNKNSTLKLRPATLTRRLKSHDSTQSRLLDLHPWYERQWGKQTCSGPAQGKSINELINKYSIDYIVSSGQTTHQDSL